MSRRRARELALQSLFHVDVGQSEVEFALFQAFARDAESPATALAEQDAEYARQLVRGASAHLGEIDKEIGQLAKEWALERMANVDRNVLRLAIFEILYRPDVPASAVVNEAVELVKQYSTAESGKFVNGILGSLLRREQQGEPHVQTISRD